MVEKDLLFGLNIKLPNLLAEIHDLSVVASNMLPIEDPSKLDQLEDHIKNIVSAASEAGLAVYDTIVKGEDLGVLV